MFHTLPENDLKALLKRSCKLTVFFHNTCANAVDAYFNFGYFLVSGILDMETCSTLGLCSSITFQDLLD